MHAEYNRGHSEKVQEPCRHCHRWQKKQHQEEQAKLDKERRMQEAQLKIKQRFGKNAILRGLNFEEGATAKERNEQIGGHKA